MTRSRLLITLLVIGLLVVYAYLGMDYMKQRKGHEMLTSQITNATQTLAEIPEPPQNLEQRLADARASLATEQSAFPNNQMGSTEVVNTILKLANDCAVMAVPLVTQPWSTEDIGDHSYHVLRLNVAAKGSFSQLVSFVSKLENTEFKTLIVENVSVTRVSEQSEEGIAPEGIIPVVASLDLAIYTQPLTFD